MKTIKLTALAAAVAMGSAPAAFADLDLYKTNQGSAVPQSTPDQSAKPGQVSKSKVVDVGEDLRVYLHTAIEIEKDYDHVDPSSDSDTEDGFDNEIEFGVGAEFDKYWEAYFEMEIDNLSDTTNSKIGDGDEGSNEITNAWIDYNKGGFEGQTGVFRPSLMGDTRIWYREHLVGLRGTYDVSDFVTVQAGSGIISEEGDDFGDDRQLTWVSASVGDFYTNVGVFQDGATDSSDPEDIGVDPAADDDFGDLYNAAVGWNSSVGAIDIAAEFNQNFGEAENGQNYKGYAAYAEFATELGMHKPRVLLGYGSGDDDANDDDVGEFEEADSDLKWTKLLIDDGGDENITTDGVGGVGDAKDGIGNITIAQLGDTIQVNSVWRADVSASYLALSEANTNGDRYLGTEIDFLNRWELPTNRKVRLYLDLAYVASGDAYGPDDVWQIEPGIRVEF